MQDIDLMKYIYIEYSVAVLVGTEVLKFFLSKLCYHWTIYLSNDQPKWITLFVASVFAVADWFFIGNAKTFNFYQMVISFGVSVLGYDYVWKVLKDQFGTLVKVLKKE